MIDAKQLTDQPVRNAFSQRSGVYLGENDIEGGERNGRCSSNGHAELLKKLQALCPRNSRIVSWPQTYAPSDLPAPAPAPSSSQQRLPSHNDLLLLKLMKRNGPWLYPPVPMSPKAGCKRGRQMLNSSVLETLQSDRMNHNVGQPATRGFPAPPSPGQLQVNTRDEADILRPHPSACYNSTSPCSTPAAAGPLSPPDAPVSPASNLSLNDYWASISSVNGNDEDSLFDMLLSSLSIDSSANNNTLPETAADLAVSGTTSHDVSQRTVPPPNYPWSPASTVGQHNQPEKDQNQTNLD